MAELANGNLVIRILLDGPEEVFTISGLSIIDGEPHLLHVRINQLNLLCFILKVRLNIYSCELIEK